MTLSLASNLFSGAFRLPGFRAAGFSPRGGSDMGNDAVSRRQEGKIAVRSHTSPHLDFRCLGPGIPRNNGEIARAEARGSEERKSEGCTAAFRHCRRGGTAIVLALIALSSTGCQTLDHRAAKEKAEARWGEVRGRFKYQLAQQQYDRGLFEAAVTTANEAVAMHPRQADAYVILARSQLELGRSASALDAIEAARRAGVVSAELVYTEGVVLEQRGDVVGALAKFDEARKLAPGNVDALIAMAESLVALNHLDEAQKLLDDNEFNFNDRASILVLSAEVCQRRGDRNGAITRYEKAIAVEPSNPWIAQELGRLLAQAGRCPEAVELLRPLLQSAPGPVDEGGVRRDLAGCYLTAGIADAAVTVLQSHLDSEPGDAVGQLLYAKAALALNDLMGATRAIELAQEHQPHQPEVWFVRAVVQWRCGDTDAAIASLQDVLANNPRDVQALCLMAELLRSRDQVDGARGYYQRVLEIEPANAWAKAGVAALIERAQEPVSEPPKAKLTAADASLR